jgi:hypothetical protein
MRTTALLGLALAVLASAEGGAATLPPKIELRSVLPGDPARVDVAAHVLPIGAGAIITGWTAVGDAPPDAFVLRVDGVGKQLWRRQLGGAGEDMLFATAVIPSGGFVAAGLTTRDKAGSEGWIIAFDDTGGVRWQTTHGGPGADRLTSVAFARRFNGFIAAGQTTRGGNVDAWVVRVDDRGKTIREWASRDSLFDAGFAVAPASDGGCVVAGSAGPSRDEADGFVTRLGADDRVLWTHRFGGPGRQLADHLAPAGGDAFLVTGYGQADPARGLDGIALLVAPDGAVRRTWSLGDSATDRAVHGLPFEDGSGVVVGYSKGRSAPDTGPVWTTVLYGLAPDGTTAWRLPLQGAGCEGGRWIAGTPEDLWVVSQVAVPDGGGRILVSRLGPPDPPEPGMR